jgi:hypothetical protein
MYILTTSMVYWSESLATDSEVSGSIPGATRLSEYLQCYALFKKENFEE